MLEHHNGAFSICAKVYLRSSNFVSELKVLPEYSSYVCNGKFWLRNSDNGGAYIDHFRPLLVAST